MAPKKAGKSKGDSLKLTREDKEQKSFPTAPGGTYYLKFVKQHTKVAPGKKEGAGNNLNVCVQISRGEHKGINIFDHIAPHVGWKIAQLLAAIKKTKMNEGTLQEIEKILHAYKDEIRAVIKKTTYDGRPKNEVVQYLPLAGGKATAADDDDLDEDELDIEDEDFEDDDDEDEDDLDEDDEDEDEDEDDDEDDDDDDFDDDEDDDDFDEDNDEDDDLDDDEEFDDDDEDEDDDDDEPAPRSRRVTKKTAAKKAPAKKKAVAKKTTAKKSTKRR